MTGDNTPPPRVPKLKYVATGECYLLVTHGKRGKDLPVHAELLQGRTDGGRGLLEVVVGDLGEEEVVRHVPVGDVVVSVVDAPPVLSVHRLHRRRGEVEVRVVKRLLQPTSDTTSRRARRSLRERGGGRRQIGGGRYWQRERQAFAQRALINHTTITAGGHHWATLRTRCGR